MKIKWIEQKHKYGCSIACIAMILNKDYDSVERHFKEDFNKKGIPTSDAIAYLAEQGLNIVVKETVGVLSTEIQNKLLFMPFADIHLVSMKQFINYKFNHSIVMNNKGIIFDPSSNKRKDIEEFYSIEVVVGCFK